MGFIGLNLRNLLLSYGFKISVSFHERFHKGSMLCNDEVRRALSWVGCLVEVWGFRTQVFRP